MKISVIVPIYNVEGLVGRCARSLFSQTMREGVEIIFVDDGSPDGSIAVVKECLNDYPQWQENTRFIYHEQNMGLPSARNSGLEVARGEYIFHCDGDDYLEADALEKMYEAATKADADVLWCDWWLSFSHNERRMKQPSLDTPLEALKAMLCGAMKFNVWNKLVRRSLYIDNDISFPEGHGMGEDMTMMMIMARAKRVAYLGEALYHYVRTNGNGFTQVASGKADERKMVDAIFNATRVENYIRSIFGDTMNFELSCFKLEVKFPLLISADKNNYQLWTKLFPEANKHVWHNKRVSLRSRVLQLMAAKGQFWYVRIYYQLLFKFVYGKIYR